MIEPFFQREFQSCFYLDIIIGDLDKDEIKEAIRNTMAIEKCVSQSLNGSIPIWELLEQIEPYIEDKDDYVEGLEENIERSLEWYLYNYKE